MEGKPTSIVPLLYARVCATNRKHIYLYESSQRWQTINHTRDDSITTYVVSTTASPSVQLPAGTLVWNVAAHLQAGACSCPWPSRSTGWRSLKAHGSWEKLKCWGFGYSVLVFWITYGLTVTLKMLRCIQTSEWATENLNLFCNKNRVKNWQSWML